MGGQGPRGMGPGTPAGYGRGRKECEGPNKKKNILDVTSRLLLQFVYVFSCLDTYLLNSCILVRKLPFYGC